MMKVKQNKISENYLISKNNEFASREKSILEEVSRKTGFKPEKLYYRSTWWTSKEFGAFTYKGTYEGKKSIIKIQGVKPNTSEIYMIKSFEKNNKSKQVRPPYLYDFIYWNNELGYEALILEDVGHERIVNSLTNSNEINEFYKIYQEYRKNCLSTPWIEKPNENLSKMVQHSFESWKKITYDLYPYHPFRKKGDRELIEKAIKLLIDHYQQVKPEFIHGHFSTGDLIKVKNQIVLRSNLYWSWKNPFRDAVFAYHWHMLNLTKAKNMNENKVNHQKKLWMNAIDNLPNNNEEKRLIKLASLERSTASLNLDALSIDSNTKISKYLVEQTRENVLILIDELS